MFDSLNKKICSHFGHKWRYKNYDNYIKANGDKYDFQASRTCKRCKELNYYYQNWIAEPKSVLDFQSDFYSTRYIRINKMLFN